MDDLIGWSGAGKWHLWQDGRSACSSEVWLLSVYKQRGTGGVHDDDLCRRCWPAPKARHLSVVKDS